MGTQGLKQVKYVRREFKKRVKHKNLSPSEKGTILKQCWNEAKHKFPDKD